MGTAHLLTRTLARVRTEMSPQVLAYTMKRMIRIVGSWSADHGDPGTSPLCTRGRRKGSLRIPATKTARSHSLGQE